MGKGFTEWTNTAKAKPLFPGHYQPHVPADLGFYDLRCPETRIAQAKLARDFGVEAFCYYHYWFGDGKRLLERPFNEVLESGEPDFPFCLCWANESWTGVWHGTPNRVLIQQSYPGRKDYERHFHALLPAFMDKRYVRIENKPLFLVYSPDELPDPHEFTDLWRELAVREGLPGMFFVGVENEPWKADENGFDGATVRVLHHAQKSEKNRWLARAKHRYREGLQRPTRLFSYEKATAEFVLPECEKIRTYPSAVPNWDNTPRSGRRGLVLEGSTPELFRKHLRAVLRQIRHKPVEHRIVFLKSWNEWAEGNHFEPDLRYGTKYLEVLQEENVLLPEKIPAQFR